MQMVIMPLAELLSLPLAWTRINASAWHSFAIAARSAFEIDTSFSVRVITTL